MVKYQIQIANYACESNINRLFIPKMLLNNIHIQTEQLTGKLFTEKNIAVSIARLDKIHPIVSGNKLFKLYFFLKQAFTTKHQTILTFGGAYSNHLLATA